MARTRIGTLAAKITADASGFVAATRQAGVAVERLKRTSVTGFGDVSSSAGMTTASMDRVAAATKRSSRAAAVFQKRLIATAAGAAFGAKQITALSRAFTRLEELDRHAKELGMTAAGYQLIERSARMARMSTDDFIAAGMPDLEKYAAAFRDISSITEKERANVNRLIDAWHKLSLTVEGAYERTVAQASGPAADLADLGSAILRGRQKLHDFANQTAVGQVLASGPLGLYNVIRGRGYTQQRGEMSSEAVVQELRGLRSVLVNIEAKAAAANDWARITAHNVHYGRR